MVMGAMLGGAAILFAVTQRQQAGIYIPCAVAEISPDVPAKAKEECRRKR